MKRAFIGIDPMGWGFRSHEENYSFFCFGHTRGAKLKVVAADVTVSPDTWRVEKPMADLPDAPTRQADGAGAMPARRQLPVRRRIPVHTTLANHPKCQRGASYPYGTGSALGNGQGMLSRRQRPRRHAVSGFMP